MNRHFLVTVSRDRSARYGVRFIQSFFSNKDDLKLTLYYTASRPPMGSEMPDFEERAEIDRMYEQRERQGRKALAEARKYLIDSGFDREGIADKLHFRKGTTAMDIVQEGERGLYDAVVLGNRGLSWLEELMESSVTREMLERRLTIPLWMCRQPELGRENVLACVDDSEQTFRMIDHVGFVLAREPGQAVTLLNVYDPNSGDRVFAEELFTHCTEILTGHGVEPERIRTRVVESYNVARAVLRVAERDRFAVVAAGRTGEDRGFMRRLFMGSVSSTLYRKLVGAVLWLCH